MNNAMKRPCLLEKGHDVSAFDCGEEALNNFLIQDAWASQLHQHTFTFVSLQENTIIAYYSLAIAAFMPQQALDRQVNEFSKYNIAALQISRLAVDIKMQRQQIGKHILQDALSRACLIAQGSGIKCLTANAINEKSRKFYQHYNFEPQPADSFRLYLLMKDITKSLL